MAKKKKTAEEERFEEEAVAELATAKKHSILKELFQYMKGSWHWVF